MRYIDITLLVICILLLLSNKANARFEVSGIPTPDFGNTLPYEALNDLRNSEAIMRQENINILYRIIDFRQNAVLRITDQIKREQLMERLLPIDGRIENYKNAFRNDNGSFAHMGNALNAIYMDLQDTVYKFH